MSDKEYKAVYVLGAGASMPYNMPSGVSLKKAIVEKLNSPQSLREKLLLNQEKYFQLLKLQANFGESPIESIDAYLEANDDQLEVGKMLIACCLFEAESKCTIDDTNTDRHWLKYLFNQMKLDRNPENLERIAFVSFNYDSLVERFFDRAFRKSFNLPAKEENPYIKHLNITHVHGSLINGYEELKNFLHDEKHPLFRRPQRFATSLDYEEDSWHRRENDRIYAQHIESASNNLRLVHDRQGDSSAQCMLSHTERIVFLGFSYDVDNLVKILPPKLKNTVESILGTSYGMSKGELFRIPYIAEYSRQIEASYPNEIFYDIDCWEMLRHRDAIPTLDPPQLVIHNTT